MADMILATADQIRDELKKLDARRARLRKLLAIAEEDEGQAEGPKPEATTAPEPPTFDRPASGSFAVDATDYDRDVTEGVRAAEAKKAGKPKEARA